MDLMKRLTTLTWKDGKALEYVGPKVIAEEFGVFVRDHRMNYEELEAMLTEMLVIRTDLSVTQVEAIVRDVITVVDNDLERGGAPLGTELCIELYLITKTDVAIGVRHAEVPSEPDSSIEDGLAMHVGYDGGTYCLMHFADVAA